MNPLAVAVQGLGFDLAQIALQGMLIFVAIEVQKNEDAGGSAIKRKTRRVMPNMATKEPDEELEALLLAGAI